MVAEGPPDQLGPGSSRYRVSYLSGGQPRRAPDRRPDRAASPPDARRPRPRRAARRPRGHPAHAGGDLPRAHRGGGGRMSADLPRLAAIPVRAQALLAQPERGLLQLPAAAADPGADRQRGGRRRGRARGDRARHRGARGGGHHVHLARLQPHLPPRGGHPQAHPRHADAGHGVPLRIHRLGHLQRVSPGGAGRRDRERDLRRRLASEPAPARGLHPAGRGLLRRARRGLLARHPERGLRSGLYQRGLPSADVHLRRLLLDRRSARRPQGGGGGAAAHAPDRRDVGGDRRRLRTMRRRPRRRWAAWTLVGLFCAVRFFRWE